MTIPPIVPLLIVSVAVLLVANIPIGALLRWLRRISNLPQRRPQDRGVPQWVTGNFERLMAFALVVLGVGEAYTILGIWLGAKLAANWQRLPSEANETGRQARAGTLIALIVGIVSVTVGVLVGHAFLCLR